ncbi:unnamed protein product [Cylicocyclus nassatus]|uniref:Uncharacterized protein n=1 Tax=Cylicocyclus nassatus TaxID=53992 RepID=A0AA36GVN5_CYLNA|nr:unnamed protein product [Cylicocyclus nassatus]
MSKYEKASSSYTTHGNNYDMFDATCNGRVAILTSPTSRGPRTMPIPMQPTYHFAMLISYARSLHGADMQTIMPRRRSQSNDRMFLQRIHRRTRDAHVLLWAVTT